MKTLSQYILIALSGLFLLISSCDKQYELGELKTPTNLTISYDIIGADAENPHGDGSGQVEFTASADNAITYTYDFGDGSSPGIAPSGKITHPFSIPGVNTFSFTVSAVGTGGITSTATGQVEVLSAFEDAEALEFLTGGDSKTWYWAANLQAHAGMGPVSEDYGAMDYTWPNWWQISPWDEEKSCMYSAELVFTKTGNSFTFEQTEGPAFIPGTYAAKIGVEGDMCHGEDVAPALYGVKNAVFAPSTTKASIDGGYRGTTIKISDGGFLCWWVGTSEYDIIEISENILRVRIEEDDSNAWYHIFTSEKPEQK